MSQQKTIKEWFELLPDPYRSQALENTIQQWRLDEEEVSINESLKGAFIWEDSSEGDYYWRNIVRKLEAGEIKLTNDQ